MFPNTPRHSLGVIVSATHLTVALFDRILGEWVYYAQQPLENAAEVLKEVQFYFGAVQVYEARI